MRIRTILAAAAAPAALAAVLLGTTAASASTAPHLTGSVVLSGPAQFESFNNIGGPNGSVSYTNFTSPSPGSGVWSLNNAEIDFGYQGQPYVHHLIVDGINVTGLNSYTFTGHGSYDPDQSYTWNATGSVVGSKISMHIVYTGTQAGYSLDFTGMIFGFAGDGTHSNSDLVDLADIDFAGLMLDVAALTVLHHFGGPLERRHFADARDIAPVPLHAELEVLIGIETLRVDGKLRHTCSPDP